MKVQLRIYPEKINPSVQRDIYNPMFTVALFTKANI